MSDNVEMENSFDQYPLSSRCQQDLLPHPTRGKGNLRNRILSKISGFLIDFQCGHSGGSRILSGQRFKKFC